MWRLRKPKLLVSMIGSSFDFDMNGEDRLQLLNGLMNVAKETDAWVLTIGLDVGLAKFVGEANRSTDAKVPLIGICPWGMVEGRQVCVCGVEQTCSRLFPGACELCLALSWSWWFTPRLYLPCFLGRCCGRKRVIGACCP